MAKPTFGWDGSKMTFLQTIFTRGGPIMWPLLICSLVSLTITVERLIFWWRDARRKRTDLAGRIVRAVEQGNDAQALALRHAAPDAVARVLLAGIADRAHGLRESMEAAATEEIEHMRWGLGVLDTIVTMAPLLGILGTVLGIIASFDLLGRSGIQDPKAVTGGIAQALITTATGLAVALVTLVPFNYFVHRVQRAAKIIEQAATRFEIVCRKGATDAVGERLRGAAGSD